MCKVYSNDTTKTVKNLGWLLRNWKIVQGFYWYDNANNSDNDGFFLAKLLDGRIFYSDFASYTIFVHWLNRSIFKGLPVSLQKLVNRDGTYKGFPFTVGEYEKLVRV